MKLSQILELDKENHWDALTLATEEQCSTLIERGVWEEDDFSRQQEAHEDMRIMLADACEEFGI
jgi:hypothetical protein